MDCEIRVRGEIDAEWSGYLEGMSLFEGLTLSVEGREAGDPITTLSGPIADQSALRGLLNRLWDLNLTLISVRCYPGERGGL